MSDKRISAVGPLGVAIPTRRAAEPRPAIGRRPPVPVTRPRTSNRFENAATGPRPPEGRPEPAQAAGGPMPHPATPPVPEAGFEALMEFTEMLEAEVAASERRALAHVKRPATPSDAVERTDKKV